MEMKSYGCVIMSYTYGHLAASCLNSIVSQTKPFDQILFVDDAYGDCEHLPSIYPEVEFDLRKTNMGLQNGFDDALQKIRSDMVMFIGADNRLRQDSLEILSKSSGDIVVYDLHISGEFAENTRRHYPHQCTPYFGGYRWSRLGTFHGSMLYNTRLAKRCGGYKIRNSKNCEDQDLFERMSKAGGTYDYIQEPLLEYNRHRGNFNQNY
jgi:GT2 family glycosyltransferase